MSDWKFNWLTSWEEVFAPAIQAKWEQWAELSSTSHVFFHPALARAWIETYRPIWDLEPLFAIASSGPTTIFLPLVRWHRNWKNAWQKIIVPVGHSDFDYADPLLLDNTSFNDWPGFWSAWRDALEGIAGTDYDEVRISGIHRSLADEEDPCWSHDAVCPYADISDDTTIEDYLRRRTKGENSELRRRHRHLAAQGCLEYKVYRGDEIAAALPSLQRFLAYHRKRWPHAYKALGFHQKLLKHGLAAGVLHFSEIRLNQVAISWHLGFAWQRRFYYYMAGFNPAFHQFSPGTLHLVSCVEDAIKKRFETFDRLRGDEPHKSGWTLRTEELMRLGWVRPGAGSRTKHWLVNRAKPIFGRDSDRATLVPADSLDRRQQHARSSAPDWKFDWLTTWEELSAPTFQDQWRRWSEESPTSHVFYHPEAAAAWIETYRPIRELEPLFAVARRGPTKIFLPLVRWRRNWKNAWQRMIVPVGYSDFDYADPLLIGDPKGMDWTSFWSALAKKIETQWGRGCDEVNIAGIRESVVGADNGHWSADAVCPYSDVSADTCIDEHLKKLPKSLRGDVNRQQRRLSSIGQLEYHIYSQAELEVASISLDRFLEVHRQRWPNAYKAPGFHLRLLSRGLAAGFGRFSELRLNAEPISWHLGFIWKDRFYYYMPAFDPAFREYSPGKVHLLYCIEAAIQKKCTIFDHLRGEDAYKAGWATSTTTLRKLAWRNRAAVSETKRWLVDSARQLVSR
jgi:CelD/BcsL family acetyltransferase involved in cellulose biosynthesis